LLKISSALPHAPILVAELQAFKASIGESGHAKFEAAAGMHDDLTIAVALALWRLSADCAPPSRRVFSAPGIYSIALRRPIYALGTGHDGGSTRRCGLPTFPVPSASQ
jgi:hypothetical protein